MNSMKRKISFQFNTGEDYYPQEGLKSSFDQDAFLEKVGRCFASIDEHLYSNGLAARDFPYCEDTYASLSKSERRKWKEDRKRHRAESPVPVLSLSEKFYLRGWQTHEETKTEQQPLGSFVTYLWHNEIEIDDRVSQKLLDELKSMLEGTGLANEVMVLDDKWDRKNHTELLIRV